MTMLKDDLVAQHYCRLLSEVIAATKTNKLLSMHLSDWCKVLKEGTQVKLKEKKGTTPDLINVDIKLEDFELFIKELQESLTIFSENNNSNTHHKEESLTLNELKSRKELQKAFGGVSASTIDRFFRYLLSKKISFYKEALHGRSDVYRLGEMKSLYSEYQASIKNKAK